MDKEKRNQFMEKMHDEIGEAHTLVPNIVSLVGMVDHDDKFEELFDIYEGIEEYGQYVTEKEAKRVVEGFVSYDGMRGAKWPPQVLFQAVESLGGEKAVKGKYNCWTLFLLMNWLHSDYGGALMTKLQGNDYALMVYQMALAWMNDKDGDHDVREYFIE